eukprot:gene20876-27717_t
MRRMLLPILPSHLLSLASRRSEDSSKVSMVNPKRAGAKSMSLQHSSPPATPRSVQSLRLLTSEQTSAGQLWLSRSLMQAGFRESAEDIYERYLSFSYGADSTKEEPKQATGRSTAIQAVQPLGQEAQPQAKPLQTFLRSANSMHFFLQVPLFFLFIGLTSIESTLVQQEITPATLTTMTPEDLDSIGIGPVGTRIKILEAAKTYEAMVTSISRMMIMCQGADSH